LDPLCKGSGDRCYGQWNFEKPESSETDIFPSNCQLNVFFLAMFAM